jgi:hypothetical protein
MLRNCKCNLQNELPSALGVFEINDCFDHFVHEESKDNGCKALYDELYILILQNYFIKEKRVNLDEAEGLNPDVDCSEPSFVELHESVYRDKEDNRKDYSDENCKPISEE